LNPGLTAPNQVRLCCARAARAARVGRRATRCRERGRVASPTTRQRTHSMLDRSMQRRLSSRSRPRSAWSGARWPSDCAELRIMPSCWSASGPAGWHARPADERVGMIQPLCESLPISGALPGKEGSHGRSVAACQGDRAAGAVREGVPCRAGGTGVQAVVGEAPAPSCGTPEPLVGRSGFGSWSAGPGASRAVSGGGARPGTPAC